MSCYCKQMYLAVELSQPLPANSDIIIAIVSRINIGIGREACFGLCCLVHNMQNSLVLNGVVSEIVV